jgi:hypothetical protein
VNTVLAAAAAGDETARRHIFETYFEPVYSLLRMALPNVAEVESATVGALATAIEHADEAPAHYTVDDWITEVALEEIAGRVPTRAADALQAPAADLSSASDAHLRQILLGLPDRSLSTAVRALELPRRQAIVLGLIAHQPVETVAAVMNRSVDDVLALQHQGLDDLAELVHRYEEETERIGLMARENAYHLRPTRGPNADGVLVIHGTRAHIGEVPPSGLMQAAIAAIERAIHKLLHRHDEQDPLDDDVGDIQMPQRPASTPSGKRFRRPEPTPSMREYKAPAATPGMQTYRSPKGTPSTARISPVGRGASAGTRRAGLTGGGWKGRP